MAQHHLHTFDTTEAFVEAYNAKTFGVPYVAVIDNIRDDNNNPTVLFSNRLPYKENEIAAPEVLSVSVVLGNGLVGASRLG